jgi:hypothetical protein
MDAKDDKQAQGAEEKADANKPAPEAEDNEDQASELGLGLRISSSRKSTFATVSISI